MRLICYFVIMLLPFATIALGEEQQPKTPEPSKTAKVLEEGIVPGSIKLPGTDLSLKIGGYVKLDFIQDFDAIGNVYQFKTDTIPMKPASGNSLGGQNTIHARETRFNLDLTGDTPKGKFRAFFEGDFYGDNNTFRIRHAFGEYGNLLGGQTWTTFMNISARPRTLDYEGPDGEAFVRQAMIRWTQPLSKSWKLAFAVESSGSQVTIPSGMTGAAQNNTPDVPISLRYESKRGNFQTAGIMRQIRFDGSGTSSDISTMGWGLNTNFRVNTVGKNGLMGQFVFGNGLGRYIESLNAQFVDAVFRGNTLKALPARAALLGYEQHWNAKWQSTFAYSVADVTTDASQASSVIKRTQDARVNLIWAPYKMVNLGSELMWGRRDNRNGDHGDDVRLQISMIFNLN